MTHQRKHLRKSKRGRLFVAGRKLMKGGKIKSNERYIVDVELDDNDSAIWTRRYYLKFPPTKEFAQKLALKLGKQGITISELKYKGKQTRSVLKKNKSFSPEELEINYT